MKKTCYATILNAVFEPDVYMCLQVTW